MADVKKTVEIALKVVGIDFNKLNKLATTFQTLQAAVDKTKTSIESLQSSLDKIKAPTSLTQVITGLQQLEKVKIPSLTGLANGFNKISQIKEPPNLAPFVTELKKFAGIKLPGITALTNGFKKLTELNVNNLINKIRSLNTALSELDKRGGISVFKKFAADVNGMRNAFSQAATSTNKIVQALDKTGNAADKAGLKIRTFGDKVSTVFQFRIISTAIQSLQQAMGSGITAIIEYDQALKDLQAITGATSLEVAQMGVKILEVASTTKFSASEVAEGMRTIGQAGFSATEAVETMQAVSDLATGTLSDMKTTVDLVTTAMRVFQIDATRSGEVADVFANAVNRSKLTIDKLRTAMNYIGPIARDSGVSFKELSASMMTLANSGLRASTIGTGLRRVFAELIDPSRKLKIAAEQAGVALNELDPRSSSLSDVMQNLGLVVGDAQQAFELFGKRGAAAVLALSNTESHFNEMLETVSRSGTAARQAAIQMEGLGVSFKNLKDKLGILAIAIGDAGLADAMRLIIDLSRGLIDALTYLVSTALGGFIVKIGVATTVALTFVTALKAIKSVMVSIGFTKMIAGITATGTAVGGLNAAWLVLRTSLGWIGVAIGAVTALFLIFKDTADETAQELNKTADTFGTLAKKYEDYLIKMSDIEEGTKKAKEANIDFRQELLKTSHEFAEISAEAQAAANSINPLNGAITGGGKAIDAYNAKLDEIQFDKLSQASAEVDKAIIKSNGFLSRSFNRAKTGLKSLISFSWETIKAMEKASLAATVFASRIADGSVSFEELGDYIENLDYSNLNDQQRGIIENYEDLNEQSDRLLKYLVESNKVGLDDTEENFKSVAKKAEITGRVLEATLQKFKDIQEANTGSFSNIIEKWAMDGEGAVVDFIDEYKKLGGVFEEGQEQQLRDSAEQKKSLVNRLNILKDQVQGEIKAGADTEEAWKNYYTKERVFLQEAAVVRANISKNSSGQNIKLIINERKELQKELDRIAIKYKNNAQLRVKYQEDATRKYLEKQKKLVQGFAIDPAAEKAAYEANLDERKVAFSKHLEEIAVLESKGVLDTEQSNMKKMEVTMAFYRDSYKEAIKYRDLVNQVDSPAEYEKRQELILKAEEKYHKEKTKYLIQYNKQATKAKEELIELDADVLDEDTKHNKTRISNKKDASKKLKDIEQDYADSVKDINEALQKKLDDINSKIADNRKSANSDVLSLESSTEEKIRQVRKKGMTDAGKETSDRNAAYKYLREGRILLAEAEQNKDEEALKRGADLISQAESLGQGLDNQNDAINILQGSLRELTKARNIEAQIEELDLLKKKEEEVADAAKKQADLKETYDKKVLDATTAIEAIKVKEDERHKVEMKNLDDEIAKYKEKAKVAGRSIDELNSKSVVRKDIGEVDDTAIVEDMRHKQEMSNIKSESSAITDKYNTARQELEKYGLSQEELDMGPDEFFASLADSAEQAHNEIQEVMDEDIRVSIDTVEIDETKEAIQAISDTALEVLAKVLGQDDVDDLKKSIKDLKDKTITITTKYVSKGQKPSGYKTGGKLPGYGGGDRNPVLAEDGEWFIRKEAARKYGDSFLSAINSMSLPKFQNGGIVGRANLGGSNVTNNNQSLQNFGKVVIDTGSMQIPAIVNQDVVGQLTTHMNNIKRFQT